MIGSSSVSSLSLTCLGGWILSVAALVASGAEGGAVTTVLAAATTLSLTAAAFWQMRVQAGIGKANEVVAAAALGDLRQRVVNIERQGALASLSRNINLVLDQFQAFGKETNAAMMAAAEARYYRKIVAKGFRGDIALYADRINATLDKMAANDQQLGMFTERMLRDAVTISMTVNEGNIANAHIVNGIKMARDQSQSMAAAIEEMVSGIQTISVDAETAADLSNKAQVVTDEGRKVMQTAMSEFAGVEQAVEQAGARVTALSDASEAIASILSSIEAIAEQTNLLALNATIEAARAGDAGRGFAVVANEVKSLATQTARSTEEISGRITRLRDEMKGIVQTMRAGTAAISSGRQAMREMEGRMGEISHLVGETSHHMTDVSRILAQQATAANEISGGVQKVAAHSDDNAVAIEKSTGSLTRIETEMGSLLQLLVKRDVPNKILLVAKADHVAWKKRLTNMLIGNLRLKPEDLSTDQTCRLGKWYFGPDAEPYRHKRAFIDLAEHHRAVHKYGIEAVRAFNAGNQDEAMYLFELVEKASEGVIACLDLLIVESRTQTDAEPAASEKRIML